MEKLGEKILYLSRRDVESLNISIPEVISCLEMMFVEKSAGRVEMPPKPAIHTNGDAFLHAMPAYVPKIKSAGMKWVGGYPENFKKNLPYISGLLVLNDTETGMPYVVMDCAWITAIRTAAATALAAKYLARPESETLAILGFGIQGRYNLETISEIFKLIRVEVFDVLETAVESYRTDKGGRFDFDLQMVSSPKEAVKDADIVVTAGPFLMNPSPIIEFDWIKTGAFVCPLDLDSYVRPEVFLKSDILCTDDTGQFAYFKESGLFQSCPDDIADLGDIISGRMPGRKHADDVITSINIGIALEDMAVAPLIYQKALASKTGVWLDL